ETEPAGDRCRGQGRAFVAPAHAKAVDDAAPRSRGLLQVTNGLVDDRAGNADARIAGGTQRLSLGDGDGTFVQIIALRITAVGHVSPAAARRLGLAGELDAPVQDIFELHPAFAVLFLSVHAGEEKEAEPVAIHVAFALVGPV